MSIKKKNNKVTAKQRLYQDETIRNFVSGNSIMEKSVEYIKDILNKEGYKAKKNFFNQEIALNLDMVESSTRKGFLRNKTVDFVVGLEKDWLLLVEAKLKVKKMENIAKDIHNKISHSRDMLKSCDTYVHSEDVVVVLLKDQNFQQHSNHLRKLLLAHSKNIRPLRVCDLYKNYFTAI